MFSGLLSYELWRWNTERLKRLTTTCFASSWGVSMPKRHRLRERRSSSTSSSSPSSHEGLIRPFAESRDPLPSTPSTVNAGSPPVTHGSEGQGSILSRLSVFPKKVATEQESGSTVQCQGEGQVPSVQCSMNPETKQDGFLWQGTHQAKPHTAYSSSTHGVTHVTQHGGTTQGWVQPQIMHGVTHVMQRGGATHTRVQPQLTAQAPAVAVKPGPTITPLGTSTIQRLPTYAHFQKLTRQTYSFNPFKAKKRGKRAGRVKQSLAYSNIKNAVLPKEGVKTHEGLESVDVAYMVYEADPSLSNLAKLYDAITYWQTFNYQLRDGLSAKEYSRLTTVLSFLQEEIKQEVKTRTAKAGGKGQDAEDLLSVSQTDLGVEGMPEPLSLVGIAPGYYRTHLQDKPEVVDALCELYAHLDHGQIKDAAIMMQGNPDLIDLPGWSMIRSMFMSHFNVLGSLTPSLQVDRSGTKRGQPLTDMEKMRLQQYTGSSSAANSALRDFLPQADDNQVDDEEDPLEDIKRAGVYGVVSALSKLHPFEGIAYRGLTPFPGIDDVWQPGATIADMAFTSAAASFQGVEYYLNAATSLSKGSNNYYCIIHSKSAVHVHDKSAHLSEAEVIFQPGTRFYIKAVWMHMNGRVPTNAPPEAQMILHRVGSSKILNDKGRGFDQESWTQQQQRRLKDNPEAQSNFKKQARVPVKVLELVEV